MNDDEFDKRFDGNEDVLQYLDSSKDRIPVQEHKRVNDDFPLWMIQLPDKVAKQSGVPRQSVIRSGIAEQLQKSSWIIQDSYW